MNPVDLYIYSFPEEVWIILEQIRSIIRDNAPGATESLAYGMPAYKLDGKPLVYFACHKNHIGFYATPSGHDKFSKELSRYRHGKGSVQFPLSEPIPFDLIESITAYRVKEIRERSR